jgi:hypothetical protein
MKALAWKLLWHLLILCGTGSALGAYHLVKIRRGGGEEIYGYFFSLLILEWPLGALIGGLVSLPLLKLRVPVGTYLGYSLGLGVIFYSAGLVTCLGLDANPVGWGIGAATLPVVSGLIVAAHERPDRNR